MARVDALLTSPEPVAMTRNSRDFLATARSLSGLIESQAQEVEALTTLTPPIVQALRDTELFWMLAPPDLGGGGCDVTALMEVIEEFARADGSAGWSFMANATAIGLCAAFLGDGAIEAMFGGAERPIMAGMLGPAGKAVEVPGGYRGSGKYAFASGGAHANWIAAGFLVLGEDGKPRTRDNGLPDALTGWVPRSQIEFTGNWDVTGLTGTGSYDYVLGETFMPSDFVFDRYAPPLRRGGRGFLLGLEGFGTCGHASVVLGLMKRAMQEIARIAPTRKRPGFTGFVVDDPVFRSEFTEMEATYRAARKYVLGVFADAQADALAGKEITAEQRARFRQATTWVHRVGPKVISFCHTWGGSDSFRQPAPLGRCLRDVYVATQHVLVDPKTLVDNAPAILASWQA